MNQIGFCPVNGAIASGRVLCYSFRMFNIFHHLLEGKGAGWSILRYAIILALAVLALTVLNTFFRLD